MTGAALLFSLLLFIYFPSTDRLSVGVQSLIAFCIFFLAFPILYVKYILGESIQTLGFRASPPTHLFRVFGAVLLGLGISFLLYQMWPALREAYELPFSVKRSFFSFVQYELFSLTILFFYEVFFRGFVMLSFLRRFGLLSIAFQFFVFLLFLFASQSFGIHQTAMILFAPFAGFIAYRSQSLWYSFLGSALFLLVIDIFLLLVTVT